MINTNKNNDIDIDKLISEGRFRRRISTTRSGQVVFITDAGPNPSGPKIAIGEDDEVDQIIASDAMPQKDWEATQRDYQIGRIAVRDFKNKLRGK